MGPVTELTYENMYQAVKDYFMTFLDTSEEGKTLTTDDYEGGKSKLERFFTKDIVTRRLDYPMFKTWDNWCKHLLTQVPEFKYKCNIEEPYGYTIVDEYQHLVGVLMREDIIDTRTGKVVRAVQNAPVFHCVIEDGYVKFDRELIIRMPGLFQIDDLMTENPGDCTTWMFRDYSVELASENGK